MSDSKEFLDNIKLEKVHNKDSEIKKVIGVISGKGGVGKSLVTSMLAVNSMRLGKRQPSWMRILQDRRFRRRSVFTEKRLVHMTTFFRLYQRAVLK